MHLWKNRGSSSQYLQQSPECPVHRVLGRELLLEPPHNENSRLISSPFCLQICMTLHSQIDILINICIRKNKQEVQVEAQLLEYGVDRSLDIPNFFGSHKVHLVSLRWFPTGQFFSALKIASPKKYLTCEWIMISPSWKTRRLRVFGGSGHRFQD